MLSPRLKYVVCPALAALSLFIFNPTALAAAATFRVAAYNVENYLDEPTETRHLVKSAEAKAKIRETIHAIKPDVLALEEMGTTNALLELRASLKSEGLDFPYWELVPGFDPSIHVAVLSRLPIVARHSHTNDSFVLDGRPFRVSRGFADIDIQAGTNFTFTLIAAHLKSKRPVPDADEEDLRLQEAKVLHSLVEEHLHANPDARLIVLGDFNDTKNTPAIKALLGRGKFKLFDTRPAERNGDTPATTRTRTEPRDVTWTDYYGVEDSYTRIDYILLSPAMVSHWLPAETYIPTIPNWGLGSDHRPVVAGFTTAEN